MKTDSWVPIAGTIMALAGLGLGYVIDDPAFHIRVVQAGNHETIFILLALIIGFTFKDQRDDDSLAALIWAIFMAIAGLLMGGLNDLESASVQRVGQYFYAGFTVSLIGTLVYLMRALRSYRRH